MVSHIQACGILRHAFFRRVTLDNAARRLIHPNTTPQNVSVFSAKTEVKVALWKRRVPACRTMMPPSWRIAARRPSGGRRRDH